MKSVKLTLTALAIVGISGCSTISDWFADDEELEIRRLEPIVQQFEPEKLWSRDIGHGVDHYYSRLQPAVAYDKVYVASRQGSVLALEQDSGKVVW